MLAKEGYNFDIAYTSVLKRAIKTLNTVLDQMDQMWIPVERSWRLNERHYGALQGLNKAETASQVRRGPGEDLAPQLRHSAAAADRRRRALSRATTRATPDVPKQELPLTECLKDTVARFLPLWHEIDRSRHQERARRVVIAAHGNSLRALVKYLDNVSEADIVELNIPTGMPLVYELDADLKPIKSYYLGDPEKVKAAMEAVAKQGKKQA